MIDIKINSKSATISSVRSASDNGKQVEQTLFVVVVAVVFGEGVEGGDMSKI